MFLCFTDEAVGCKVVLYVKAFVSVYLEENIDLVDWCLVPPIRSNWFTDIEKLICKGKNEKRTFYALRSVTMYYLSQMTDSNGPYLNRKSKAFYVYFHKQCSLVLGTRGSWFARSFFLCFVFLMSSPELGNRSYWKKNKTVLKQFDQTNDIKVGVWHVTRRNKYTNCQVLHTSGGFHKLSTIQEWQHCNFVLALPLEMNMKTATLKNILLNPLLFNFTFANPIWCQHRGKLQKMRRQSWHWCQYCQFCEFAKTSTVSFLSSWEVIIPQLRWQFYHWFATCTYCTRANS